MLVNGVMNAIRNGARNALLGAAKTVIKSYDANWFARALQQAAEEDWATGGVTDPYDQHAYVNIAVNAIARNIARAEFKIYDGDNELPESNEVVKLFMNVNPQMSRFQLWEATLSWKKTKQEAFWIFEKGYRHENIPKAIYVIDPGTFDFKVNEDGSDVALWIYQKGREKIPLLPDEVIHFHEWNRKSLFRGHNPLVAQEMAIEQDIKSDISNLKLLDNKSTPAGILSSERPLSEPQAKEIVAMWEKQHKGVSRVHKIGVLGYGTKFQQISLSPADLEYMQMKKWNRTIILAKYGVPPAVVGVKDEMTPLSGKDTSEQMKAFWDFTLIPEIRAIEDKLRTEFFGRFKLKFKGRFDLSVIPELQEDEAVKRERDRQDVKEGLSTINEVRKSRNQDPLPWGDTWWVPFNLVPADGGGKKAPEKEEKPKEDEEKSLSFIRSQKIRFWPVYPQAFRLRHWEQVIKKWESLEIDFRNQLRDWMYEQRSEMLEMIATEWGVSPERALEMADDPTFWSKHDGKLMDLCWANYLLAAKQTEEDIKMLFESMGLPDIAASLDIFSTGAVGRLEFRLDKIKGIDDTLQGQIRDALRGGIEEGKSIKQMADDIRDVYNIGQSRAATIARTELGGAYNDSRIESYLTSGFLYHEWLSAGDKDVRTSHQIDTEVRLIGEPFSNGLLYPNELEGAAAEICNCRCLTLPVMEAPEKMFLERRPLLLADVGGNGNVGNA